MGLFDLQPFVGLGMIEIAIGVSAAVVSLASLTGVYRAEAAPVAEQDAAPALSS
jgi:hypothetical protein